jgi:glutamate racemase
VGVIGTLATIQSGAYEDAIRRHRPDAEIHSLACPLLVSFAEEGWLDDPITDAVCRRYLNQIPFQVRTVVLGCTHYPTLLASLARTRPGTTWLDSGELTAGTVERLLQGRLGFRTASAQGRLRILLTDAGSRLQEIGARFLGEPLESVDLVEL